MKFRLLVTILLLSRLPTAAGSVEDQPKEALARFALVIGKNEPEDLQQAPLRYADDDAIAMHALLREAGVRSRLLVVPDEDTVALRRFHGATAPTLNAVLHTATALFEAIAAAKRTGARTELTFYYSGHGDVIDGEGFVVLEGGRLTRTTLLEQIVARSPADINHIIIDW